MSEPSIGTVIFFQGRALINGQQPATIGATVKHGDTLVTGDNSACEITVRNKNVMRLGANSALVFNLSEDDNRLLLIRGRLTAVCRKLMTKQAQFTVETPTAVAGIRGTSFFIGVESPDSSYFCVCNGSVRLNDTTVTSPHHAGVRFVRNAKGQITKDNHPGMLYHGDADLETLAAKIGEKINWKTPDR